MTIKVTATSPIAGDAIEVTLPVVPEGVAQYKNKAKFVDLRQSNTYRTDFTVDVPANAVKDSTQVSFSLIGKKNSFKIDHLAEIFYGKLTGDIMGVTLKNIQLLIQLPCGCGEQTMLGNSLSSFILLKIRHKW